MFLLIEISLWELYWTIGEVDETTGLVVYTTNVFTLKGLLTFPAESVTVMVQL